MNYKTFYLNKGSVYKRFNLILLIIDIKLFKYILFFLMLKISAKTLFLSDNYFFCRYYL